LTPLLSSKEKIFGAVRSTMSKSVYSPKFQIAEIKKKAPPYPVENKQSDPRAPKLAQEC
jgi:hypothetical protein